MTQLVNNGSDILHSLAGFDPRSVRFVYILSAVLCHHYHIVQWSRNRDKFLTLGHKTICTLLSTDVGEAN
jgi:hypothetical protein